MVSGEAGGHAHPAALSGIKTQAIQSSQGGSGVYNQLVFDDSPGQSRLGLQRYTTVHQGTAKLNLGHHPSSTRPARNGSTTTTAKTKERRRERARSIHRSPIQTVKAPMAPPHLYKYERPSELVPEDLAKVPLHGLDTIWQTNENTYQSSRQPQIEIEQCG